MRRFLRGKLIYAVAVGCFLSVLFCVMAFTGMWPWRTNNYASYTLQACAWLQGRLDIPNGEAYAYLELAIKDGKYFVSFPPFPSYVLLPFAAVCGMHTPDAALALIVACVGLVYAVRLLRAYLHSDALALFWALFLYAGGGMLFLCVNGWVWFFAQNLCFTLSILALDFARRGRGVLSLTCWAAAVGCRPMTALYLPVLLHLLLRAQPDASHPVRTLARHWYWLLGAAVLAASYMTLNALRFGSVFEFGHNYLPEFTRTAEGQFSLTYLKDNLRTALALPAVTSDGLDWPTINGTAFYLVNPLYLAAALAWGWAVFRRRRGNVFTLTALPLLTLAYIVILLCHRTLGGWHFGSRYFVDMLPYLAYGIAVWSPRDRCFALCCAPLAALGAGLNLIGTVAVYNHWL